MQLRERVARAIAKARVFDVDPETRIFLHNVWRTRDGANVLPPENTTMPLWAHYLDAADAAIAEMEAYIGESD